MAARIIAQPVCHARGTNAITRYRDCRARRAAAVRCGDVARRVNVERDRARRADRARLAVAVAERGKRRADRAVVAARTIAQPACRARGTNAVTRYRDCRARRAAVVRCEDVARRVNVERDRARRTDRARLAVVVAYRAAMAARIIAQPACRTRGTNAATRYRDCRARHAAAVWCEEVAWRVNVERGRARRADRPLDE